MFYSPPLQSLPRAGRRTRSPPTHGGAPGRSSGGFHPPIAPREGPRGHRGTAGVSSEIFASRDPSKGRDDTPGPLNDSGGGVGLKLVDAEASLRRDHLQASAQFSGEQFSGAQFGAQILSAADPPPRPASQSALSSNPLFGSVNKEQVDILVNNMKRQQVGRGEALINQGEADGAHFYIVLSGGFDVYLDQV